MVKLFLPLAPSLKPGEYNRQPVARDSRKGGAGENGPPETNVPTLGMEPEDIGSRSGLCLSTGLLSLEGPGGIQNLFFLSLWTTEP